MAGLAPFLQSLKYLSGLPLSSHLIAPLWFILMTGFGVEMDQSRCLSVSGASSRLVSGIAMSYVSGIILILECSLSVTASLSDHTNNYEETLCPVLLVTSQRF